MYCILIQVCTHGADRGTDGDVEESREGWRNQHYYIIHVYLSIVGAEKKYTEQFDTGVTRNAL